MTKQANKEYTILFRTPYPNIFSKITNCAKPIYF